MFSICMITRNEAAKLRICLEHLKEYPVEIIVVDTGSTDQSKEIASIYTDQIYDFEWCKDFSAARNFAASKAHHDWIWMLDTDEYAETFDYNQIIALLKQCPEQVGRILRVNQLNRNGEIDLQKEHIGRFYQKSYFHYVGRIHEQICPIEERDYHTFQVPITVMHSGYQGTEAQLKEKAQRNIILLTKELELQKSEGREDPYIIYQLGKSYYMKQDYEQALLYFEQATSYDLNPRLEYVLDLIIAYGYCLLQRKEYQQALNFEGIYNEFSYSADFLFLMGLIYMNNERFQQAIKQFQLATLQQDYMVQGVNSFKAYYNIGVIYECLGQVKEAVDYYSQCKDYDKAKERLKFYE